MQIPKGTSTQPAPGPCLWHGVTAHATVARIMRYLQVLRCHECGDVHSRAKNIKKKGDARDLLVFEPCRTTKLDCPLEEPIIVRLNWFNTTGVGALAYTTNPSAAGCCGTQLHVHARTLAHVHIDAYP